MSVVKIEKLVKRYKDLVAVDHFDMEVQAGEILGLLGPNGSGKTTILNCLLALLPYDKGTIEVFGEPMQANSYHLKQQIGVVFQNIAVLDELTVYENVDYFCGLSIADKNLRKQYTKEAIEFVQLQSYEKMYPPKLSGGLLRRLNIACGIAHKPKLIILDEPTVAVDPQSRDYILQGIRKLNREGATIIYTSHYMEEIEQLCNRIIIMDKGKKLVAGTKEELKSLIKTGETIKIDILHLEPLHLEHLKRKENVFSATYEDSTLTVRCQQGNHNLSGILKYLDEQGIAYGRILSELPTLNDVFLELTGKDLRD